MFYWPQVIQHENLNRGRSECVQDHGYSFHQCVRSAVARIVGCRWHLGENKSYSVSGEHRSLFEEMDDVSSMPECTTVEQMIQHQALNYELFTLEQKHLRNLTKCLVPCNFKRYQLSGSPVSLSSKILRLGNRSLSFCLLKKEKLKGSFQHKRSTLELCVHWGWNQTWGFRVQGN